MTQHPETQHPDEGTLRAHLDGELPPGEAATLRVHLESCASCWVVRAELEHAASVVAGAVARLPAVQPRPYWARAAVLGRLEGTQGPVRPVPAGPPASPVFPLPERRRPGGAPRLPGWMRLAAAMVLGAVGVGVSTLPGSPLRDWIEERGSPDTAPSDGAVAAWVSAERGEVAVFVPPENGRVRIDLAGLPSGEQVRVELVDGGSVGVHVLDGARFETAPGRLHVVVESGGVRIDMPRTLRSLAVWGNGERYVTGSPEKMELVGPNAVQQGDTVLFVVDSPPSDTLR